MDSNFSLNSLLELVLTIGRSANHNDTRTNSTYRIKNTNAIPVADETIAQAKSPSHKFIKDYRVFAA
jgi:hypothetical protein